MILEVRTYRLHPGTTTEFVRIMRDESVPLLLGQGVTVVDCGASLVAEDGVEHAYLIRAYSSLAERDAQEEEFYGSSAWRDGPREAIMSRIVDYHTVVIDTTADAVAALTRR